MATIVDSSNEGGSIMQHAVSKAIDAISNVIIGQENVIEKLFIAILVDGHVLLESVPGSGKTKLAKSFARVINGSFNRIQFTPDVLPSDVTGIRFFNPQTQEFEMRTGPVLTTILLADEINRATPKTQSSLLEAMGEGQATIDGITVPIPAPFMVLATQNPIENGQGTFPLPQAQLDRFLFKINLSYPSIEEEKEILRTNRSEDPLQSLIPMLSLQDLQEVKADIQLVTMSEAVTDYLLRIVQATREHPDIMHGVSTRGALSLMKASQAHAWLRGRSFVQPEDVKALAPFVLSHRIVLEMTATFKSENMEVIQAILHTIDVPVEIEGS